MSHHSTTLDPMASKPNNLVIDTAVEKPESGTGMEFFRHDGDGLICWTYPTDIAAMHWRAPNPGERPGVTGCTRNHAANLTRLPEADARRAIQSGTIATRRA